MSIDATKLANLLALSLSGRAACCAYLKVVWSATDATQTRYYSDAVYNEMIPFTGVGVAMAARVIVAKGKTFAEEVEFELNSDLRTDNVKIVLDDIDKAITGKFQAYGSGVQCEIFFYFPDEALTVSMWTGQLQAPPVYGWKQIETVTTNGSRSRELQIPHRGRPVTCAPNAFGGLLTAEAAETSLCPYQKQNGGLGNFKTGSTSYSDCPAQTEADCILRLGSDSRGRAIYFGGFIVDAPAVAFPAHHDPGFIAVSEGNATRLANPIRVIAGTKHVRAIQMLLFSRITPPGVAHGFVDLVGELGEGPVASIYNIQVADKFIESINQLTRPGSRGQGNTGFAANGASNFSGTALIRAVYGWVDSGTIDPTNLSAECDVVGFTNVPVFTTGGAYTRSGSNNRVWWLLACYSDQRWGMGYPFSRVTTDDWVTVSDWSTTLINFAATYADGETKNYPHYRTSFNAILEGRSAADQIEDICRSGGISVPYWDAGKLTLSAFRVATAGELSAARVFTDAGETRNIVWDNGQPSITLAQTPNDKLVNEVELTFEDSANKDAARPITADDKAQKTLAGRQLGGGNLMIVNKKFSGFGINTEAEAVKTAYRFLRFGDFDSGGTHNNLKATFLVPFEQALGVKRYDVIKIQSDLLSGFLSPEAEAFQYFRVLSIKKTSGYRCQIVAQAYNHTAYTNFETAVTIHTCPDGQHWDYTAGACVLDDISHECPIGWHWDFDQGICVRDIPDYKAPPSALTVSASYNNTTKNIEVVIS